MKKRILIFLLIVMVLLSGCASPKRDAASEMVEAPAMPMSGIPMEEAAEAEEYRQDYDTAEGTQIERVVIKTAEISISVEKPTETMREINAMANRMGGFVVSSNTWKSTDYSRGRSYDRADITIRVPAAKLDSALEEIRGMSATGTEGVLSESQTGKDVTSDFVDSESRLRNLQAAEEQLIKLMENTTDLKYTMEVFRELTSVREQIEVLQGHIKYLKESAALSSITISLVSEASLQPIEIGGWKPQGVVRESIEKLVRRFQDLMDFLIRFGIGCLPFLIPLGLGIFFLIRALRKRAANRPKRNKKKDEVSPVAGPEEEHALTEPEEKP